MLDEISLVRLVQSPALDLSPLAALTGGAAPKLDPTRIVWSGDSLGGMMGTMTTAVEPELKASALQVPGGAFINLIATDSARVHTLVDTVARGLYAPVGDEALDAFHPVPNLMAQVTEAGDPLAFAPHIFGAPFTFADGPRAPANVLVTYSISDEIMPNIATHALLGAMGIPIAAPNLVAPEGLAVATAPFSKNLAASTGGAVQYSPGTHGIGYMRWDHVDFVPGFPFDEADDRFPRLPKQVTIEMPVREHDQGVVHFFTTALAGAAEIVVTKPPVPYDPTAP